MWGSCGENARTCALLARFSRKDIESQYALAPNTTELNSYGARTTLPRILWLSTSRSTITYDSMPICIGPEAKLVNTDHGVARASHFS